LFGLAFEASNLSLECEQIEATKRCFSLDADQKFTFDLILFNIKSNMHFLYLLIWIHAFAEIYESMSEKWGLVDVGVIVCGPSTLQTSVAEEIRSHSLTRQRHHPIFHFHSHSFDL